MDIKNRILKARFSLSKRIGMYEDIQAFLGGNFDCPYRHSHGHVVNVPDQDDPGIQGAYSSRAMAWIRAYYLSRFTRTGSFP